MNSGPRKLPRMTSEPNGGGYEKDYEGGYGGKVGGGSKALGRSNGGFRRGDSPDQNSRTERGRESPLYSKYSHRGERDLRREQYGPGGKKDLRDPDRDRDRSPRDRNNYSNYERKEKERKQEALESGRGMRVGLERRVNSHLMHASSNAAPQPVSCGDWTEHKSSNGKKYYYNIKTEVSQWEKPREWVEFEKSSSRSLHPTPVSGRESWGGLDKQGVGGGQRVQNTAKLICDTRNSRSSAEKHSLDDRPRSSPSLQQSSSRHRDRRGDRIGPAFSQSNPLESSRTLLHSSSVNSNLTNHHQDDRHVRETVSSHRVSESNSSQGDATPTSEGENDGREQEQVTHPGGVVSLSAVIPRISSQPPQHGLSISTQHGPGPGQYCPTSYSASQSSLAGLHGLQSPGSGGQSEGGGHTSPSVLSPSLQSKLTLHTLPPPIQLTPSLSRLYREDLIGHVLSWPAEQVEKCSNRVGEETHQISSHGITKVSADLKMARSLVRLAEIQATLQEQRILFLRQQVTDLDRVDKPVSREMSRDRDTLTREGLQHRDQTIRESLLSGRDPQAVLLQRGDALAREANSCLSRETSRESSQSTRQSYSRELSRETSRDLSDLATIIPADNFQSPSALSYPR